MHTRALFQDNDIAHAMTMPAIAPPLSMKGMESPADRERHWVHSLTHLQEVGWLGTSPRNATSLENSPESLESPQSTSALLNTRKEEALLHVAE